jgi:DEAD/DEAH box helicase domain-containing protein
MAGVSVGARVFRALIPLARRERGPRSVVVFDLETLRGPEECGGWEHAERFGLAVGVTWCAAHGYRSWEEREAAALVAYLARFERVVGFNVLSFDYSVLSAYQPDVWPLLVPRTLDLLEDVRRGLGYRVGLDALCAATLGRGKSGSGADAPRLWQEGERLRVMRYCRDDVRLTRDLYLHGLRRGFIRYPGGTLVVGGRWSDQRVGKQGSHGTISGKRSSTGHRPSRSGGRGRD